MNTQLKTYNDWLKVRVAFINSKGRTSKIARSTVYAKQGLSNDDIRGYYLVYKWKYLDKGR